MKPKNWNDILALFLLVVIPLLWFMAAKGVAAFSAEVTGALIATWTLVVQYYFRRQPPSDGAAPPPTP